MNGILIFPCVFKPRQQPEQAATHHRQKGSRQQPFCLFVPFLHSHSFLLLSRPVLETARQSCIPGFWPVSAASQSTGLLPLIPTLQLSFLILPFFLKAFAVSVQRTLSFFWSPFSESPPSIVNVLDNILISDFLIVNSIDNYFLFLLVCQFYWHYN